MLNPVLISVIAVVIAVACVFLIFRFGKTFFKIFSVILFVFILVIIIFGSFLVNDALSFKEGVSTKQTLFLLNKNSTMLSGIVVIPPKRETGADIRQRYFLNISTKEMREVGNLDQEEKDRQPYRFVDTGTLKKYETYYENGSLDNMSHPYYKIFLINYSVFDGLNETFDFGLGNLSSEELLGALDSKDVTGYLADILSSNTTITPQILKNNLESQLGESGDVRGMIFAVMLSDVIGGRNVSISPIINYVQDGEIQVYPETILFSTLRGIPTSFVNAAENVGGIQ